VQLAETAAQVPPSQLPVVQSDPALQRWPMPHGSQIAPPQSVSVSSWFSVPSVHVPGAASQRPSAPQSPLRQSPATAHIAPTPQPSQVAPPQSMSVSSWLRSPSVQVGVSGVTQVIETVSQLRLSQSAARAHPSPTAQ